MSDNKGGDAVVTITDPLWGKRYRRYYSHVLADDSADECCVHLRHVTIYTMVPAGTIRGWWQYRGELHYEQVLRLRFVSANDQLTVYRSDSA